MGRASWIIITLYSQGSLKWKAEAEESEGDVITEEWSEKSNVAGFEDEGRGYELRNVGGHQKPEKTREWILFCSLQKGMQPCWHLDVSLPRPVLDF